MRLGTWRIRRHHRAIVKQFGPHVMDENDQNARYVRDGAPDCLVGHILYRAGWTIDELKSVDNVWDSTVPVNISFEDPDLHHKNHLFLHRVTLAGRKMLAKAQERQDEGMAWKYCI